MAKDFDEKLTTLSKKFHILDVGCIRDTLENCNGDVDIAISFLSSMLESPAEPDRASEKARPNSDDDEEFKRVLEISQQEEREKQAILDCLNKSDEDNVDTNKKPDPPPTPISVPTQSSPVPTVSFAQQAKTGGNFQQPASEPLPVSQLRSQVEIKDGYNLYVMRGLPGSGKSTLAKSMVKSYNDAGKKGVICSADDFFIDNRGKYNFDMTRLSEAHEHCRLKADQFMKKGFEAVIVDNTNTEIWQMLPYAKMALSYRYRISIEEPNTVWKLNVRELARRNRHNVPQQRISIMKQNWEMCTTTELVKIARGMSLVSGMQPRPPFAVPLHSPIVFSPGPRLLGPPIGLPRHINPRMPLRPMLTMNPQRLKPMNPVAPRLQSPSPPKQQPSTVPTSKPKFQMQANAVNVPDKVRETMAPPPASDPERFRCPPIADQEEALGRSRTTSKSISSEDLINTRSSSRNEEKLIPTDLLIEQDSEEVMNSSENGLSDELQQPIGFGRRNRNRNSSSHYEDELDYSYASNMQSDWNLSGGLTKSSSQTGVWSDQPRQKAPSNTNEVGVQTGEVPKTKSRVITATGDYQTAQGTIFENAWNNMQHWSGQTVEEEINDETSPGMIQTLREMFPKFSEQELRSTLSECCFNEERAIDSILSSLYLDDEVAEDDFDYNQDVIDYMAGDVERRSNASSPTFLDDNAEPFVIRRGEDLMEQLAKRFGKSTDNMSNEFHIPMKLAMEIMEWWPTSSEETSILSQSQELSDEQLALALQEADLREQQEENDDQEARNEEFPSLIPGQQPRQKPQGDWSTCDGKRSNFSAKLSIEKLQKLFPSMPKERLEDYLSDHNNVYSTTVRTLLLLFDQKSTAAKTKPRSRPSSAEPHQPEIINHTRRYDSNRKEAEFYRQKWEECKNKATDASRRRDATGGGEAAKHREDAQRFYGLWQQAQDQAANTLFKKNNERFQGTADANYFDFHGLHRDEAVKKLKELLPEVTAQGYYSHIFIITGQGKHSKGNKAKIRKAVEIYLSQHDYKFNSHRDNPGLLKVFLRKK